MMFFVGFVGKHLHYIHFHFLVSLTQLMVSWWGKGDISLQIPMTLPIPSMYGIFTYIWWIFMVNAGKYTIHGCYGLVDFLALLDWQILDRYYLCGLFSWGVLTEKVIREAVV